MKEREKIGEEQLEQALDKLEVSLKWLIGAEDVLAVWDGNRQELQLEIYEEKEQYRVIQIQKSAVGS